MTVFGIATALVVGIVIGVVGRLLIRGKRDIPAWLTPAIGVAGALLGTTIVSVLSAELSNSNPVTLSAQLALATGGVAVVIRTAGLRSQGGPDDRQPAAQARANPPAGTSRSIGGMH
ncbi:MAG: GlsB/YeaQ/YmgE family stress response membrane protein [Micromonosporaceae bacterium]|nr:GlsB/YeaQ/YmgE family stress response membrane protein [Micromonosporaceae bacterium]